MLSIAQKDVVLTGHAIECRINAEDASRDFLPSPGRLVRWEPPEGEGVRVDSHCEAGYVIPPFYDSMIGKLIVHAPDRDTAIARTLKALRSFGIEGVTTTIAFQASVLEHPDFKSGAVTTRWVEEKFLK